MLTERARAKVNLCLHITGRREDGFHLLDSLVVFPDIADKLTFKLGAKTSLSIDGPFAYGLDTQNNLVLDAARIMGVTGAFHLTKNLPVSAGIGGGSADAAAALRLLSLASDTPLPNGDQVAQLGADVPVCLSSTPTRMRGIGELLEPLSPLPPFAILLVNPGVAVETRIVFSTLARVNNPEITTVPSLDRTETLFAYLREQRNDMQLAAEAIAPEIRQVINKIEAQTGCELARMSGSGSTCFGLFHDLDAATRAARELTRLGWWARAAMV